MKQKLAMIAFGGNALLRSGQKGTYAEQLANVEDTCEQLWPLIKDGWNIVIGHGNGPQVGNGLLRHDAGAKLCGLPAMDPKARGKQAQSVLTYWPWNQAPARQAVDRIARLEAPEAAPILRLMDVVLYVSQTDPGI